LALAAAVLAALALGGTAGAATPTQIYKDYADNGRLDGNYSRSELNAALKDAVLQGYGNQVVEAGLGPAAGNKNVAGRGGTLPFTGTDLALMVLGGGALVILGLALRRLGRRPTSTG
jgi:hypothetical protein